MGPSSLPADDQEWSALKAEIERQVRLVESSIQLADQHLTWLRVGNPEVLLERAVIAEPANSQQSDPFWAATWRAAQGLDRYLANLQLTGARVLELGCGSGQAGVAAALRGARVFSTDCVPLALQVARLNAWCVQSHIEFCLLNWGRERLPGDKFTIILGSDLVYDPALFADLEACARAHLADDGRLYLSEPHRHTGDRFSVWIRQQGWQTHEHDIDLNDGRVPIRIFECWLD